MPDGTSDTNLSLHSSNESNEPIVSASVQYAGDIIAACGAAQFPPTPFQRRGPPLHHPTTAFHTKSIERRLMDAICSAGKSSRTAAVIVFLSGSATCS